MPQATSHSLADAQAKKARGAFFTPQPIATFLVQWAVRSPSDTIFEPSCGEAAFLLEAVSRLRSLGADAIGSQQIRGTDIDAPSVEAARDLLAALGANGSLAVGDFFDIEPAQQFSAVIGNPPYVRYHAFTGAERSKGLKAALAQGVRLTALASSWAAFVVNATAFLAPHGRLALVLPAELLSVNYAAPVRRFLLKRFARIRLVLFEERVFPGVMEEVVLLLAEGHGPTDHCDLLQTKNVSTLSSIDGRKWTPVDAEDKWVTGLLPPDAASLYAGLAAGRAYAPLASWGETNLGMVTGNNRYFALSAIRARELGLSAGDLLRICPPGSRHLRGLGFTDKAWRDMLADGSAGYLFDPDPVQPSQAARAYITAGEQDSVHTAYKCRNRSPWWRVPRVPVPDAFFTYMNHDAPRIVANRARVACLNSIHGIVFAKEHRHLALDLLPIAALNTVTLLGAELVGRAYGGGLLKLEPREADRLPVPSRGLLEASDGELRALRPQLARGLRQRRLLDVVAEVDKVLRPHLKLSPADRAQLRRARATLFRRRVSRSRG